jgi:hypothetical protein
VLPASTAGLEAALCKFTAASMTKYHNIAGQKLQSVRLLWSHGSHWIVWEQRETALSLPKITPRLSCSLSWLSYPTYIQNAYKCINNLAQNTSMKEMARDTSKMACRDVYVNFPEQQDV